jgi:hypothetical protein
MGEGDMSDDDSNPFDSPLPERPPFGLESWRPILGIDPGVTGGIAFLLSSGAIEAGDLPTVAGSVDIDALVRRIRNQRPRLAIVERAQAMPKQGVSSTFKYGVAYGALCAVTALLEIPTHLVTPAKWKKHFNLDSDKEKSRALAIRLWPGCGLFERKKDHGRAEAALIARYGAEVLERVLR